jgi:hypothetical protein
MNKYILADMVTEKFIRELGMVERLLPEEIKTLEKDLPTGRLRFDSALYQAEKLKRITIGRRSRGDSGAGTVVMLISDDEYDLPFILADMAFDFFGKGRISAGFQLRPLIKDKESMRTYIDAFQNWYEAICKLPGEPVFLDVGKFLKANPAPINYLASLPDDYADELIIFAGQFIDIFVDIYRKVEPVKDAERRSKMDAFRLEYNQKILGDDYSGKMLIEAFGRQKAAMFYDYLVYL